MHSSTAMLVLAAAVVAALVPHVAAQLGTPSSFTSMGGPQGFGGAGYNAQGQGQAGQFQHGQVPYGQVQHGQIGSPQSMPMHANYGGQNSSPVFSSIRPTGNFVANQIAKLNRKAIKKHAKAVGKEAKHQTLQNYGMRLPAQPTWAMGQVPHGAPTGGYTMNQGPVGTPVGSSGMGIGSYRAAPGGMGVNAWN